QRQAALQALRMLRRHGHQALWVGGCVRDLLLGREPADYDIATSATPDEVMRIFPRTYAVGAQFGVVLVPLNALGVKVTPKADEAAGQGQAAAHGMETAAPDPEAPSAEMAEHGHSIEVATFRSDGAYADGRHPDAVRFSTSAQHDVERRDFTINGLLLDPLSPRPNTPHGELLDWVGGRRDLECGVVRTIGEPSRRFAEDKLRMLRAVRFAARFGYAIEPATMQAIVAQAPHIRQVSWERVRDELTKMLTEGQAQRAFQLLDESGLLREVLPEIVRMKGVEQPPQFHPEGDVFVHTLLLLSYLPAGCSPTLAWGALLHDVGKPATFRRAPDRIRFDGHVEIAVRIADELLTRLRFSNRDREQALALVDNHMRFADVRKMKEATFKRFVRLAEFDEHLALHRLDCLASHGQLDLYDYTRERLAALPAGATRPAPLINGHDLIAAGFTPGPRFAEILSAVEEAQLEGTITTREAAMNFVESNFDRQ
ncbi:MAG TPA: CCA tRNA nucleotidyltransferase, partial [Roseiflexaceae bacterium]